VLSTSTVDHKSPMEMFTKLSPLCRSRGKLTIFLL